MSIELPGWMSENNPQSCQGRARRQGSYLARSLKNFGRFLLYDLWAERMARQQGWWQGLNPALKLISAVILILMVSLARNPWNPILVWLITVLAMAGSRLPLLALQARIWGVIPLITLLLSLPAALNVVTPGTPFLWITHEPVHLLGVNVAAIYVTVQGLNGVCLLVLRVGVSLSLAALLVATTPATEIMRSLRFLGMPSFAVMVIEMAYRYIVMMVQCSLEMFEARQMRTVGDMTTRDKAALVASSAGGLFGRSMALAEETYLAMTDRGYTGDVRMLENAGIKTGDAGWAALITAVIVILAVGGYWLG